MHGFSINLIRFFEKVNVVFSRSMHAFYGGYSTIIRIGNSALAQCLDKKKKRAST